MNPECCEAFTKRERHRSVRLEHNQDSQELHGGFTGLGPDGSNLSFYLFNFLHVAATLMVWDLCFKLGDLLLILPVDGKSFEEQKDETLSTINLQFRNDHHQSLETTYLLRVISSSTTFLLLPMVIVVGV